MRGVVKPKTDKAEEGNEDGNEKKEEEVSRKTTDGLRARNGRRLVRLHHRK